MLDKLFGGGSRNKTSTVSQSINDPRFMKERDRTFDLMNTVTNTPFQNYTDPRFADFNTDQLNAMQATRNLQGSGQNNYQNAQNVAGNVANRSFGPITGGNLITGGSPGGPQLSQYMNQYDQGVIDKVGQDYAKALEIGSRNVGSSARAANAFGGSRHGVQEALSDDLNTQNYLGTVAGLRQAGFNQAADRMAGDLNRGLQAQIASGNLGLGQGQLNLAGANQQAALQDTARRAAYGDAQALQQIGLLQQAQNQQQLNFDYNQFQQQQMHPERMLALRQSILGGLPYNQQTIKTTPQTRNPITGMLGGAATAGALGAMGGLTFSANPIAMGGLMLGGGLLGAMS